MPLKTCPKGHSFRKSSDCPACPVCEGALKPSSGFMAELPAPARRALDNAGITTLAKLAKHSEKELLALHGVGPAALPVLRKALGKSGKAFKKEARSAKRAT